MAQSRRRFSGALSCSFSLLLNSQSPLRPSASISSRCFGSTKLFVGGLSFRTDEDSLRNAFAAHGEVTDAKVISDRDTGRPRGFGFVNFVSESEAETALAKMDGKVLDGRVIRVDRASVRAPAPRPLRDAGFDVTSGSSSGFSPGPPLFHSSPPASAVDWGSIPSLNAGVPQNASVSLGAEMKIGSSFDTIPSGSDDSIMEEPLRSTNAVFDMPMAENSSSNSSATVESASTTAIETPPVNNQGSNSSQGGSVLPSASSESKDGAATPSRSGLDISSFPSFDDINFDDAPPLPRRKLRLRPPPISQSIFPSSTEPRPHFGGNNAVDTGIPKPSGPEFDFGLSDIEPPPTEPGARPQGGFDIRIPPGSLRHEVSATPPTPRPLGFSIFQPKIIYNPDFPYDKPEADNWSDIGSDPPKLYLSSLYSPLRNFVSKDKELHWDPFDFDEDAKLPPEPEASVAS